MRQAAKHGDFGAWFSAHTEYHRVCTAAAGQALQRQLRAFADRTTRYIRIYQLSEPNSWQAAGDVEHAAILEALIAGDEHGALSEMAHHLERPRCGCWPTARRISCRWRCRTRWR